jgi:predicted transcriptional regulator
MVLDELKTRSSTEIIGLILQAVEGEPITRSKIMYQTMLNFKQVTDYAALLTDAGLMRYLKEFRQYTITEKGRQFLSLFKETNELLMMAKNNNNNNMVINNQEQKQHREVVLHE